MYEIFINSYYDRIKPLQEYEFTLLKNNHNYVGH